MSFAPLDQLPVKVLPTQDEIPPEPVVQTPSQPSQVLPPQPSTSPTPQLSPQHTPQTTLTVGLPEYETEISLSTPEEKTMVGQPLSSLSPIDLIELEQSTSPVESTLDVIESPPGPQNVQNPFLDEYQPPPSGKLTITGQPLNRINVPYIPTLVAEPKISTEILPLVETQVHQTGPIGARLLQDPNMGIELNINLFGEEGIPQAGVLNPAEIPRDTQDLPTTFQQAKEKLPLITAQRAGKNKRSYGIKEIQQIAKNLHLPSSGNKGVVANRIRAAVMEYFDMQK